MAFFRAKKNQQPGLTTRGWRMRGRKMMAATQEKEDTMLRPTIQEVQQQITAIWAKNPLGGVAMDALGMTLLGAACTRTPEVNDETRWRKFSEKDVQSIDAQQYMIKCHGMPSFRISELYVYTSLTAILYDLAYQVRLVLDKNSPVGGSMKLHLTPLRDKIVPVLTFLDKIG